MLHQSGAGVLGPVFRGVHDSDDRTQAAAVKVFVFDSTPERSQECGRMFQRLATIQPAHPALVRIVEAGTEGSLVYVAQEYVSGVPLDALLRDRGPLSMDEALGVLGQLAAAIEACAGVGVVHGRLHPRDVLVSLPSVWMTGHGVAAILEECGMTAPTRRPYTAPERQMRQPWDSRADVYSLGAIAFELITGRRLGATGDASTLAASSSLEPALREVLTRAMSGDPDARFQSAPEFVDALAAATPPTATVAGASEPDAPVPVEPAFRPALLDVDADVMGPGPEIVAESSPALFAASGFRQGESDEAARGFGWVAAAALLLVGVTLGFAGGYGAALRAGRPSAPAAEPVVAPKERVPVVSAREWTDGTVAEPPKRVEAPEPIPVREEPVGRRDTQTTKRDARPNLEAPIARPALRDAVAPASESLGVIAIRTRPEGARVFLNGRPVGTAPLVLTDVAAGSHRVGLELPGYQRWTSMVQVGSGTRHSVTASLDRVR